MAFKCVTHTCIYVLSAARLLEVVKLNPVLMRDLENEAKLLNDRVDLLTLDYHQFDWKINHPKKGPLVGADLHRAQSMIQRVKSIMIFFLSNLKRVEPLSLKEIIELAIQDQQNKIRFNLKRVRFRP